MRMKKYFIIIIFIALAIRCYSNDYLSNSDFNISGMNELNFVYRNVDDSLHQFMEDKFKFDLTYKNFRFGMKYIAELPKFDKFGPADELSSNSISSRWDERYLEFDSEHFDIRAGNFDAVFGSGIILNAYENEDLDENNRLEGCKTSFSYDIFTISGIYGVAENEENKNDLVSGLDLEIFPIDFIKIGFSGLNERFYVNGPIYEYNKRDVYGSRVELFHDLFDLNFEYAKSEKYRNLVDDLSGNALYGNLNVYVGMFTFTTAYKNYENFNDRFSEIPTVNYSELALAEYGNHSIPGFEEEGIQGIVRFNPNFENEFVLNYAEGWSKDKSTLQSDLHTEYIHQFLNSSITVEYNQVERIADSETTYYWEKETKPKISYDFMVNELPMLLKAEFKTKFIDKYGHETTEHEPSLQTDISFGDYSLSLLSTYKFHNMDDIKDNKLKLGAEIVASILNHTTLKLFAGSEKGGQVCRNGICNYQAPFEGIRLNIVTRF